MFIHLMFNEDKIIYYLYVFILIYAYIVHHILILMQYMQIIQKKGNMKIYVIINIYVTIQYVLIYGENETQIISFKEIILKN